MKNRIKILYLLTIAGIVAFCLLESFWLRLRFAAAIQEQEKAEFDRVVSRLDKYFSEQRERLPQKGFVYGLRYEQTVNGTRLNVQIIEIDSTAWEQWNKMDDEERKTLQASNNLPKGYTRYKFDTLETSKYDVQDLIGRFLVRKATGFNADSLQRLCDVGETRFVVNQKQLLSAKHTASGSLWRPQMQIAYPLSPLEKLTAEITVNVPMDKAVNKMALTLLLSFIVAILLVFCLVYQMATIRKQQKVAELQKSFTLTMLHELKRPLAALKLFISFMKNERLDVSDREAALANASHEIDNLSSYFNKLRAITYNEASEMPLSLSPFNLKEAIEESAAMVDGASVSLDGEEDATIVAERQSIVNVLCNLIENAVKYSKPSESSESPISSESSKSSESSNIRISWKALKGSIEISIADRGRGIPDTDKHHIFDQFYRAVEGTDIPGMGLGLAYVRQIVNAHGGNVSVKDRDGGGTVFTINLPQ